MPSAEAALAVEEGDFSELLELSDGGLFALRLDETVPPALPPLGEIEDEVAQAWRASVLRSQLAARGEALVGRLASGATLEDMGRVDRETQVRRQDFIPDAPRPLWRRCSSSTGPATRCWCPPRAGLHRAARRDQPPRHVMTRAPGS